MTSSKVIIGSGTGPPDTWWAQVAHDIWTVIWITIKTSVNPSVFPWMILFLAVLSIVGWRLGKASALLG